MGGTWTLWVAHLPGAVDGRQDFRGGLALAAEAVDAIKLGIGEAGLVQNDRQSWRRDTGPGHSLWKSPHGRRRLCTQTPPEGSLAPGDTLLHANIRFRVPPGPG